MSYRRRQDFHRQRYLPPRPVPFSLPVAVIHTPIDGKDCGVCADHDTVAINLIFRYQDSTGIHMMCHCCAIIKGNIPSFEIVSGKETSSKEVSCCFVCSKSFNAGLTTSRVLSLPCTSFDFYWSVALPTALDLDYFLKIQTFLQQEVFAWLLPKVLFALIGSYLVDWVDAQVLLWGEECNKRSNKAVILKQTTWYWRFTGVTNVQLDELSLLCKRKPRTLFGLKLT